MATYRAVLGFSSFKIIEMKVTRIGTMDYCKDKWCKYSITCHIASLQTPDWYSNVLKFCSWKYCDRLIPIHPIKRQYFISLQVTSFNIFLVPTAKKKSKMKQMTYRKKTGAATYHLVHFRAILTVMNLVFMQGAANSRYMPMLTCVIASIG